MLLEVAHELLEFALRHEDVPHEALRAEVLRHPGLGAQGGEGALVLHRENLSVHGRVLVERIDEVLHRVRIPHRHELAGLLDLRLQTSDLGLELTDFYRHCPELLGNDVQGSLHLLLLFVFLLFLLLLGPNQVLDRRSQDFLRQAPREVEAEVALVLLELLEALPDVGDVLRLALCPHQLHLDHGQLLVLLLQHVCHVRTLVL
mmetsp:Transcript_58620/g.148540  ORF Transcript_58620/g.148540 Transcript_58620/m.148540 type:complete len:203 (-) Transcript_58620:883-1491(-)